MLSSPFLLERQPLERCSVLIKVHTTRKQVPSKKEVGLSRNKLGRDYIE